MEITASGAPPPPSVFLRIFGSKWPLYVPPWPFPRLPDLQVNSLDLRESGLDLAETNFRPKIF